MANFMFVPFICALVLVTGAPSTPHDITTTSSLQSASSGAAGTTKQAIQHISVTHAATVTPNTHTSAPMTSRGPSTMAPDTTTTAPQHTHTSAPMTSREPATMAPDTTTTAMPHTHTSAPLTTRQPSKVTPDPTTITTSHTTTTTTSHSTTKTSHTTTTTKSHSTTMTSHKTTAVTTAGTTEDPFREKCYDGLGCFNNSYPFNNDGSTLPMDPQHVGTEFRLFTRNQEKNFYKTLTYDTNDTSIRDVHFNVSRKTRIIVHGFSNTIDEEWMHNIKDAFLKIEDSNVIIVGWGPGANGAYGQAVADTRLVARQLTLLLERLVKEAGLDLKYVHLVGHSLGAHTSGNVGRQLNGKVGRITAMDPAGPNFEGYNNYVIVDKTDALFVDTIHTNGKALIMGGAGMFTASGHVDFYVNGGRTQPGCKDGLSAIFSGASISCSHGRSHEVFLESITSECSFTAYPCINQTYFQLGQCLDCEPGGCSELGLYADQHKARGPRYLNTQAQSPYCGFHYAVTIQAGTGANTKGAIHVALLGTWGSTDMMQITEKEDQAITASTNLVGVVVSSVEVGQIQNITVRYVKYAGTWGWSWLGGGSNSVKIDSVQVLSGESGRTARFCIPESQRVMTHSDDVTIPATATLTC